jgi:signal transduction histidine kinase
MSDIVWAINPNKDHLSDLTQRMRHFASDVFSARQIDFILRTPATEKDVRMGANFRRELFLVFKEAVNNIARHSGCTRAEIEFRVDDGNLVLRLRDNGRGFDLSRESEGHGLKSMHGRTEGLGGSLEISSRSGEGTTLTFRIPLRENEHALTAAES